MTRWLLMAAALLGAVPAAGCALPSGPGDNGSARVRGPYVAGAGGGGP